MGGTCRKDSLRCCDTSTPARNSGKPAQTSEPRAGRNREWRFCPDVTLSSVWKGSLFRPHGELSRRAIDAAKRNRTLYCWAAISPKLRQRLRTLSPRMQHSVAERAAAAGTSATTQFPPPRVRSQGNRRVCIPGGYRPFADAREWDSEYRCRCRLRPSGPAELRGPEPERRRDDSRFSSIRLRRGLPSSLSCGRP